MEKPMTIQSNGYSCGSVCFSNATRVIGLEYSYSEAKKLVGTTSRWGTSKEGMLRGLKDAGLTTTVYKQKGEDAAWRWLVKWCATNPIILLVDANQHWASVSGKINNNVIFIDPSAEIKNSESGTFIYSKPELMWRWKNRICYAIRVSR